MSKLAQLRGQRDAKVTEVKRLTALYPADKRLPKADADRIDALLYEIEQIDDEINRDQRLLERSAGEHVHGDFNAQTDTWRHGENEIKVMRTVSDIRAHYRASNAPTAPEDRIDLVNFVRGVAGMKTTPAVKNALSVGTNTAGGYAVPNVIMPEILAALLPVSSLLNAGAGIVPLGDQAKTFTTAAVSTIPTAAWRLEAGNIAASDPTFRAVVATPQSLAFYFKVSRELLADAPNIDQALRTAIAGAFAKELDRAGLRGTGTAPEPRGILNTSGIQAVTNGANGTALASYANFLSAYSAILGADAPAPTAAIMSPRSLIKLAGLIDTTNQPLQAPKLIEPMRMIATSQVPNNLTVGSSSDSSEIYFADFRAMLMMIREQMSIQLLVEKFADTGEIGFMCHARADYALTYPAQFAVVTGVRP